MHLRDILNDGIGTEFAEHPDAAVLAMDLTDDEWVSVQDECPQLNPEVPATIARALAYLARARRTYARPRPPGRGRGPTRTRRRVSAREHAVAALFAHHAEHERGEAFGIAAFHRDVLRGRWLAVDEVTTWIERQRQIQGPVGSRRPSGRTARSGIRVPLLAWADPDAAWTSWVATKRGSRLDRLRRISEALSRFYGWPPAGATLFVLTGRAPQHQAIRTTVRHRTPLQVRSRVVLEIDPMSTPADVADEYRRVRRLHFGTRLRRLSDKHAQLAMFHLAHQDLGPSEALATWNRTWPPFRYRSLSAFRRDGRDALVRLREMSLRPIAPQLP
jgi:hypothetical protein